MLSAAVPPYWVPYIYQYGVGGLFFVIGLVVILRSGACRLSRRQDRFWFGVLVFGMCWYAGLHLAWYLAAIYILPTSMGSGG